ncbi:MAG: DUF523 domain-containing protein [Desulfuromonadales bacterium]
MDKKTLVTPILVSACLLGLPTRYDGKAKRSQAVLDYLKQQGLLPIPVCPEQLAGLATPRDQTYFHCGNGHAVLSGEGQVVSASGRNMNAIFCHGARVTLQLARLTGCQKALLKERSPSCGVHQIYRGEQRQAGTGITTALLIENGIEVISEEDL